ncbi:MAG TPA: ComEA family DNA-binding protein [Dehalococcoidia bacterium]|jgi:competence protein ComEA|nr:ComEA family DNA-binding protein [Dehalococcoidia bacterium]
MSGSQKYWALVIIFLIAVIIGGGLAIWARYPRSQPVEIILPPTQEMLGEIYVGGEVSNPGIYPFKEDDTISDIIQAAGGVAAGADLSELKLYIPSANEEALPQKVNINRAEAWLLEALPGIGPSRAQAIIRYRQQNGRFHHTSELLEVEGIGIITYEKIKHLITVDD